MLKSTLIRSGAVAAIAALALAGCAPSAPAEGESDGPAVITFAASMLGEPARGPKLVAMIDEFNASQDDVVVTPMTVPFSSFSSTMFTQMGGGAGPDLIAFDHPDFFSAVDAGLVLPIDDVVDEDALLPGTKNQIVDGTRYGVSLDIGNYALIYNPTIVSEAPTTFDELLETAKSVTGDGVYGYAFRHTPAEEAGVWYDASNYVYGYGGKWSDDGEPTINSPENVEGITALKEIYDAGVIPQGATAAEYRKMFAEGKIAMMIDNGGVPTVIQGTNAEAPIAAAVAPFPTDVIGQVMAVLSINANTKNEAATKQFLGWLLEETQQTTIQNFLGGSTPATRIERSAEDLETKPYVEIFDQTGDNALSFVPEGLEVYTPQIRNIVVTAILEAFQTDGDVQEALDDAQSQVEGLVG